MSGGIGALTEALRFQAEALKLRSYRQELIAANIANSDTPNYKAVDFDFAQALRNATDNTGAQAHPAAPAQTEPGHLPGGGVTAEAPKLMYHQPSQASLDGNSVEMDVERAKFADNTVRYQAALAALNAKIKALLAVVQG